MDGMIGDRTRWSVLWTTKDKVIEKTCGSDLMEAVRIYNLAREAGKPNATLRCMNVGFPPPEKYAPGWVTVKRKKKVRGKMRVVQEEKFVEPLAKLNNHGWWWCPYCMQMRKFEHQDGFLMDGRYVAAPGEYCPICGVSDRDAHVRKWNPRAKILYVQNNTSRRGHGRRKRSRRSG